jgi:hypothetical protein
MLSTLSAAPAVSPFPGIAPTRPRPQLSLVLPGTYGNRMAKHLHLPSAPSVSVKTQRKAQLAVTRLRSETGLIDRTTPFSCEPAFTVQLHLRHVSPCRLWLHGRPVPVDTAQEEGSVSIVDLEQDPSFYLGSAFDMVQFYVPRAALDDFADENDGCRCETLAWPFGKVEGESGWPDCTLSSSAGMQAISQSFCACVQAGNRPTALPLAFAAADRCG